MCQLPMLMCDRPFNPITWGVKIGPIQWARDSNYHNYLPTLTQEFYLDLDSQRYKLYAMITPKGLLCPVFSIWV